MNERKFFDEEATSQLAAMIRERVNTDRTAGPAVGQPDSDTPEEAEPKIDVLKKAKENGTLRPVKEVLAEYGDMSLMGAGVRSEDIEKLEGIPGFHKVKDTSSGPSIEELEDFPFSVKGDPYAGSYSPSHVEYELTSLRDWRLFGLTTRRTLMVVDSTDEGVRNVSLKAFAHYVRIFEPLIAVVGDCRASDRVRSLMRHVTPDIVCLVPGGDQPMFTSRGTTSYGDMVNGLSSIMFDSGRDTVLIHV